MPVELHPNSREGSEEDIRESIEYKLSILLKDAGVYGKVRQELLKKIMRLIKEKKEEMKL